MDQQTSYPVCPERNVPSAFERFLGPDSAGIERFGAVEFHSLRLRSRQRSLDSLASVYAKATERLATGIQAGGTYVLASAFAASRIIVSVSWMVAYASALQLDRALAVTIALVTRTLRSEIFRKRVAATM